MENFKISSSSWRIIETIIKRYPETKQEYLETVESIIDSSSFNDGQPKAKSLQSIVERKTLKLDSTKMLRMEKEIKAIERAFETLDSTGKHLIQTRYWSGEKNQKIPYTKIDGVFISERSMHRIVHSFFKTIGYELGEI